MKCKEIRRVAGQRNYFVKGEVMSLKSKLKERDKQLKIDIPAVFIALKRKDTPIIVKILALVTVAYALSPIDLIPDFIPVLGFLDDIIKLPGLVALIVKLMPSEVFEECRKEAAGFRCYSQACIFLRR
jgi:uncharacterized membrane protein YkvA (DUF1232 family)